MRLNCVVIDTTHDLIQIPYLTMQIKSANSKTECKTQTYAHDDIKTTPRMATKTINACVDHPSEGKTAGTVIDPSGKIHRNANLRVS